MKLGEPLGDAVARQQYFSFRPDTVADVPMLSGFREEAAVLADLLRFYRFTPTSPPAADQAGGDVGAPEPLVRFNDAQASPAIVRRRYGRGVVLMFYSTAGAEWNNWAKGITLTYLPVMNEMVASLGGHRRRELAAAVGQPIVLPVDGAALGATVGVKTPDPKVAPPVERRLETTDGRQILRFTDTRWAGIYQLHLPDGADPDVPFALVARNADGGEGDLGEATGEELSDLAGQADFTYIDRLAAIDATVDREYWQWLLVAVLIAAALEVFLGQRFGHYPPRPSKTPKAIPAVRVAAAKVVDQD